MKAKQKGNKMNTYDNIKNKTALIKAVKTYANELDDMVVADNLRMLAMRERTDRLYAKEFGETYNGTEFAFLAEFVADEMEATNGGSWQFSAAEIVALIEVE